MDRLKTVISLVIAHLAIARINFYLGYYDRQEKNGTLKFTHYAEFMDWTKEKNKKRRNHEKLQPEHKSFPYWLALKKTS